MGVDLCTYVGPYVRLVLRSVEVEKQLLACDNQRCSRRGRHSTAKYCPDCGMVVGIVTLREHRVPSIHDLMLEDELVSLNGEESRAASVIYLGANNWPRAGEGPVPRRFSYGDEGQHTSFGSIDMAAELRWFADKYKVTLNRLKSASKEFEIDWGIHQYWS